MLNKVGGSLVFPSIKQQKLTVQNSEWSFSYYNEYDNILKHVDDVIKEIEVYCREEFTSHRVQVSIKGIPFLFAFFIKEKKICVYTPRLGRELFLLECIEEYKLKDKSIGELASTDSYLSFKEYVDQVASLSTFDFPTQHEITTARYGLEPIIDNERLIALDSDVEKMIKELKHNINSYQTSLFEKMSDYGLDLTARYALLRIHMLKFLAILPSLDHDTSGVEVKRILLESFRRLALDSRSAKRLQLKGQEAALPDGLYYTIRASFYIAKLIPAGPLATLIRTSVRFLAKRFIAGESIEKVETSFNGLFDTGRDVTLDQLGELVVSEKEADHYRDEVIKLIEGFGKYVKKGEKNKAGIYRSHVSIKVSALCSDFKAHAFDYTYKLVAPRLRLILMTAKKHEVFINIDAEHYDYRDLVLKIYRKVLLETPELKDYQQTGIVLQAYLRDGAAHLKDIISLAKERGMRMPIRIVKGAYWDAETVEADAHNFDAPEFLNKEETDLNFRQLIIEIFNNDPDVQLCLASHNFEDHCFAVALRDKYYPQIPAIEHQCLHMTYEALSTALVKMGWATRNYVPVGSLLVGMAYLVRRIMENSSQVGVLTIMRSHKKMNRLQGPGEVHKEKRKNGEIVGDMTIESLTSDFFNITPARLYIEEHLSSLLSALEQFKAGMGEAYKTDRSYTGTEQEVICSSAPELKVGSLVHATVDEALDAAKTALDTFHSGAWSDLHFIKRCACLLKAADIMLARRNELSALIVYESGKSVYEALADVDEAIDFLNFYARSERILQSKNDNARARGPICAITPWNFPLAIPTGMISAPLVAGNTVVLKPAEQTPLIASVLVDIMHEAGVPKDVLIFVPGKGSVVGSALVNSEYFAGQVFTGSKTVGMMIAHQSGKKVFNNTSLKRNYPVKAITEMGGKNAIIVTANAELDETVSGILYSSFAHAGQKCSAASRVIVHESVKEALIERLKEACHDIEVSEAYNVSCAINPVVSLEEKERLIREVKEAAKEAEDNKGRVIVNRSDEDLPGFCVGPTIIDLPAVAAVSPNSFARRELFGPVVHIISYKTLDEALMIFNRNDYALTGGVFSQSQDDIDYLTGKMECGNIYVNRSITGARVAIEPFGGFKLSGTGPKAGSKAYVASFHYFLEEEFNYNCSVDKGSDYDFDFCRPSGLWVNARIAKIESALELIVARFEVLYGTTGFEKTALKNFQKWIRNHGESFITKNHANRRIPGQVCYSDFTMTGEYAYVVSNSERPALATFFQVISAMCMGVGVTVSCCNEKSYSWWVSVHNYFVKVGISKDNFNVFYTSSDKLKEKIVNPHVSYIIVDGDLDWINEVNGLVFDEKYSEERMRMILTSFDSVALEDYSRQLVTFAWVRAFAVNTMRHGAPLEVNLEG